MRVRNHRLVDEVHNIAFVARPNVGGGIDPRYRVLHNPAGLSEAGCFGGFQIPTCKVLASCRFALDRT